MAYIINQWQPLHCGDQNSDYDQNNDKVYATTSSILISRECLTNYLGALYNKWKQSNVGGQTTVMAFLQTNTLALVIHLIN